MPENTTITPAVFTGAVEHLVEFLEQKFPAGDPLFISDIKDSLGRQCVDLVQEGGGVYGIALAGYTYILEKMNITFMKMAGTSAGSINTLLLASVVTKEEAKKLGLDEQKYYPTRSEKVLEYLAHKNLNDLVDGHPAWRKLILKIFTSKDGMKRFFQKLSSWKKWAIVTGLLFVLMPLLALGLGFFSTNATVTKIFWSITCIAAGLLLVLLIFWLILFLFIRFLYRHAERLGINPGSDFEKWIDKILTENKLDTIRLFKEKIKKESEAFFPKYAPCGKKEIQEKSENLAVLPDARNPDQFNIDQILALIVNNSISMDYISDKLNEIYPAASADAQKELNNKMSDIITAFEERTCNAINQKMPGPGTFSKEVVIVASDLTNEIKVEFPGMHRMYWGDNLDISPACYVRASMSVPFFFKPFQVSYDKDQMHAIQEEWSNYSKVNKNLGEYALFVDGGVLSNFPINVFNVPTIPLPRKPTIGIRLEYDDQSTSDPVNNLGGFALGMISTMRFFYDRDFLLKNEIYRKTVRTVDTGNIHWLNFGLTDQQKVELFYRGALTATIFIAKHRATETEIAGLCEKGKAVKFKNEQAETFSIYHDGPENFKSEDLDKLVGNVSFSWDEYKKLRIRALLELPIQKQNLKDQASAFKTLPKK